jgi:DNA repair protein RadD
VTIELRPYQTEAVDNALQSIDAGKNTVLSMPTGSGKSLVIAGIATARDAKIVVLQPTKEILEQNFAKLYEFGHRQMDIFSAAAGRKGQGQVTFATIGSIMNRLEPFRNTDIVIVDEAHLVNAKMGQYKEFIDWLGKPVIGLTATPYRMAASFGGEVVEAKFLHRTRPRIFHGIGHIVQNADLHRNGYLVPVSYVEAEDYNPYEIALKSTGLNYDERALTEYNRLHEICRKTADTVVGNYEAVRHFLIFVASIDESQQIETMLRAAGIRADHVDGKTPKRERERILSDFKAGRTKAVTNVGVLTTGFDFPALDGIILGRPTMSLPLYYQMVGRGVRTNPGKDLCRVFDLCGNVARFGRPDEYVIECPDGYKHRLKSGEDYLTGVNFVTGRDLEKQREYRAKKHAREQAAVGVLTVPFGKYKGTLLAKVPGDYLDWCARNFDDGKWKSVFADELKRRRERVVA